MTDFIDLSIIYDEMENDSFDELEILIDGIERILEEYWWLCEGDLCVYIQNESDVKTYTALKKVLMNTVRVCTLITRHYAEILEIMDSVDVANQKSFLSK